MIISKKTIIFQGFRGSPTFSRGGGGVQMLISIETHITCDFPGCGRGGGGGGGSGPLFPLWIRTCLPYQWTSTPSPQLVHPLRLLQSLVQKYLHFPPFYLLLYETKYSITFLKRPLKKKTKTCFSRPIIA